MLSMKFSLIYNQQNFIYAYFKKMVKYLVEEKTIKKKQKFLRIPKLFF